jgi:hypothetical protein
VSTQSVKTDNTELAYGGVPGGDREVLQEKTLGRPTLDTSTGFSKGMKEFVDTCLINEPNKRYALGKRCEAKISERRRASSWHIRG